MFKFLEYEVTSCLLIYHSPKYEIQFSQPLQEKNMTKKVSCSIRLDSTLFSVRYFMWQFQKLNIKFYFSLKLNQDPCVEDVPEVKGYEKYSDQGCNSHSKSTTSHLRMSFAGALSKQNVVDASFPYCLCLVFKILLKKTL